MGHCSVEDVGNKHVFRRNNDPVSIKNWPFKQFKLPGKPPMTGTHQGWTTVDVNESSPVGVKAKWRLEWAFKPQGSGYQDVLEPRLKVLSLSIVEQP